MSTRFAIEIPSFHFFLNIGVVDSLHATIFPGIFRGSEKEDVLSRDVETSEVFVGPSIGGCLDAWVENIFAIVDPVWCFEFE